MLSITQVKYDTNKPSLHHPPLSYKPLSILPKSRHEGSSCKLRWEHIVEGHTFQSSVMLFAQGHGQHQEQTTSKVEQGEAFRENICFSPLWLERVWLSGIHLASHVSFSGQCPFPLTASYSGKSSMSVWKLELPEECNSVCVWTIWHLYALILILTTTIIRSVVQF